VQVVPQSRQRELHPLVARVGEGVRRGVPVIQSTISWIMAQITFWSFMGIVTVLALIYLFFIAEPLYVSESIVSLRGQSSASGGITGLLSSSVLGGGSGSSNEAVLLYMQSPDLLKKLDAKLHLRAAYSASDRNWFNRMDSDADWETMLLKYQATIDAEPNSTDATIIDLKVSDRDPQRSTAINNEIVTQSIKFMNDLSDAIRVATLRTANAEFESAMKAVGQAKPFEQTMAEQRLVAAQQGLAAASSLASQQQAFLVRVAGPTLPTEVILPERWLDLGAILACAACLYVILYLVFQNIKDHRHA